MVPCGPVEQRGLNLITPLSFPRDKEPHDPADNSYPQDNAYGYCKEYGKKEGQLEDQKKERDQ
jgi:hypothetical protein